MESSGGPFIAAVKHILGTRGIGVSDEVRAPLRRLAPPESALLDRWLAAPVAST
jgi:dihydrodipicolinate synthase/N-acetylneuraminate lyase